MKSKNDVLKLLAQQAKDRLKNRSYTDPNEAKRNMKRSFRVYEGGLKAEYKLVLINNQEDEAFYKKVKELLDENIDIVDPIGSLVDNSKFLKMSSHEKERYVFMLADKYREMKERYQKEILGIDNLG